MEWTLEQKPVIALELAVVGREYDVEVVLPPSARHGE